MCNAPATYQRTIDKALRNVPYSLPYLDDTLTHSSSFSEHLNHLRATLECYRKAGLQLRRDKCKFAYCELEFVGHVVSANGHRPTPTLVERIRVQKQPNSVRELKAFLGLTNYYREYIRNYALIASPLYRLMAGRAVWSWKMEQREAFHDLCNALVTYPVLAFPQWENDFFLEVNASKEAVGGVLSQEDFLGRRRPIAFFSSKLDRAQRNYSATELETFAVVAATRKWRKYLEAAGRVIIFSDHNSLQWLRRQPDPRGKFSR